MQICKTIELKAADFLEFKFRLECLFITLILRRFVADFKVLAIVLFLSQVDILYEY